MYRGFPYNKMLKSILLVSCQRRCISLAIPLSATHYQVLGVKADSTQAEIKAAYYNLSKMYHPDMNTSAEAAESFRAITEAYEVLGNVNLKRLYDKGVITKQGHVYPEEKETDLEKFHRVRNTRHKTPEYGRDKYYDYGTWTKEHYGEQLNREKFRRRAINLKRTLRDAKEGNSTRDALICITLFIFLGISIIINENFDKVKRKSD